ncbi:shikimate dehydrogenase [Jeotgalibacillus alimentarius]|uniref:Shikimate dehydrogenase (NADP(+)) n=1 Tax=Jeotgalibacillus alimentarius TaxID=135826 RepID=A0A0C2VX11_9BACL|nr:shikimate dehydrogenase [Jeotgalibacillus alimentarius]KIL53402.1 shikimate dehydrogenase [Jeotgalibacillus alimentarius]
MKLAVIGYPIHHSKSPFMHNTWLQECGLKGSYEAFEVSPDQLREQVVDFEKENFTGYNVTIPHKENIIQYLDEIDASAAELGAVNTVVIRNGKSYGYNTDGHGFLKSLLTKRTAQEVKSSDILIVGAGGAAKGIAGSLHSFGAEKISIANRTVTKADQLIESHGLTGDSMDLAAAQEQIGRFDIIINTTSQGMYPHIHQEALDASEMKAGSLAADIIYNPLKTQYLKKAEAAGADILNGVGMFVFQGALAFEKWTDREPDTASMINKITQDMNQE